MSKKTLNLLLNQAMRDKDILAIILFGSRARKEARADSDTDLCLVFQNKQYKPLYLSQKRLKYLAFGDFDISVYQQLPLYVRKRIAREGEILFVRDLDQLYNLAFRTAQAFEDFKHHYYDYLDEVAHG